MWRFQVLIFVSYTLLAVSGILTLLLTLSFSRGQRKRFPILARLDGRQLSLGSAAALSILLGFALSAYRDGLIVRRSFSLQPGPATLQATLATLDAFELELLEASSRAVSDARTHFQAAQKLFNAGDYRAAIPEYRASLTALPTLSAYLNLGVSFRWSFQLPEAERVFMAGLRKARADKRSRFQAHFLFQLGSVQSSRQAKADAGEKALLSSLALYRELHDEPGMANASLNLSLIYRSQGKFDAYRELEQNALELYERTGNELGIANVLQNRAHHEAFKGNLENSLALTRESYEEYKQLGNVFGQTAAQYYIGVCLLSLGRYEEAEIEFRSALELARVLGDLTTVAIIKSQLAFLNLENANFAAALELAREAQAIAQEHQLNVTPFTLFVVSQCLLDMGDYGGALEVAEEAAIAAEASQSPIYKADVLMLRGMIMLRSGSAREAIALLRDSADQNSALENPVSVASALKGLGEALLAIGESEEGLETLREAEAMFKSMGLNVQDARRLRSLIREEEERQRAVSSFVGQETGLAAPSNWTRTSSALSHGALT